MTGYEALDALETAHRAIYCPRLEPGQQHCWHEPGGYWPDVLPPPLTCCWCGTPSTRADDSPLRHGPCVPGGE